MTRAEGALPDDQQIMAYAIYQWDCPVCDETNDEPGDPAGEVVECQDCKGSFRVGETR